MYCQTFESLYFAPFSKMYTTLLETTPQNYTLCFLILILCFFIMDSIYMGYNEGMAYFNVNI